MFLSLRISQNDQSNVLGNTENVRCPYVAKLV